MTRRSVPPSDTIGSPLGSLFSITVAILGLAMVLIAITGYGLPHGDVLWLGGVIVTCAAFVREERRA